MYCTKCGKNLIEEMKYCPYCGNPVENISNRNSSATSSENIAATNSFLNLEENIILLENINVALPIYYSIAEIQSKIAEQEKKKMDATRITGFKLFIGAISYMILLLITGVLMAITIEDLRVEDIFSVPAMIVIIGYVIFVSKAQSKTQEKINELTTQLNTYIENNKCEELFYLPEKYRYYIAAAYIKECLESGRAKNLSEALNLFEEQMHRWKMENMQYQIYLANMQQVALAKYKR